MENFGKAPVAKPGYSSGLVYNLGKPQVAGSNPARGSFHSSFSVHFTDIFWYRGFL